MGIESYAAEVKVPLIFDNSLSFFLHKCYYYYCYNDLSWVKRFPSIQISEWNRLANLAFFSTRFFRQSERDASVRHGSLEQNFVGTHLYNWVGEGGYWARIEKQYDD